MYAKSTRPSAKRDVQKFRSAQRDDRVLRSAKRDNRIARPRRAQTYERSELRAKRAAREARDENVPAKRADFFVLFLCEKMSYVSFYAEKILAISN